MRRHWVLALAAVCCGSQASAEVIGDERAVPFHLDWATIQRNHVSPALLSDFGLFLFQARFTSLDGFGRAGATGSPVPQRRPLVNNSPFIRTSGPDANSCAGCHNQPRIGAGGDFVADVFIGAA